MKRLLLKITVVFVQTMFITMALSAQNHCAAVVTLRDTTIAPGEAVTLQAHNLFEYHWYPESAFDHPEDSIQTVSPIVTTDYLVSGRYMSVNIVSNGDFEAGDVGFISQYNYWNTNSNTWGVIGAEGTYTINTTSANVHNNFGTFPCIDHTLANGSGHCMYVNGAGTDNVIVWQQELYDIAPNTDYIFITWVATLSQGQTHSNANELAHLQFSINGVTIGNIFNASSTTAEWNRFYQIWNSGNSTVATITILNQCTATSGNDFALDDISFCPLYPCEDTVTVRVNYPIAANPDSVKACRGETKTINPMQNDEIDEFCAALNPVSPEIIQFPEHAIATVMASGNMQIQFDDDFVGRDTMRYRICCDNACDTSVIYLISTGFESEFSDTACFQYSWNGNIYNASGNYQHTYTATNGCDSMVTLHLTILEPTVNILNYNSLFCETHTAILEAQGDMDEYVWNDGTVGSTLEVTDPGVYSVTGSNKYCEVTAQITIPHCDFTVYIPNTITPGTPDDLNDFLSISDYVKSEIKEFEILIYDRWGELVFASIDKDFKWDGRVKGRLLQNVIYTYAIKYRNQDNQEVLLKGTILVL